MASALTITVPRSMYPPGYRSQTTRRRKGRKTGRKSTARRVSGRTVHGHRAIRVTCIKCGRNHSSVEHLSHGYGSFIRSRRGIGYRRKAPAKKHKSSKKRAKPNYNTYIYRG